MSAETNRQHVVTVNETIPVLTDRVYQWDGRIGNESTLVQRQAANEAVMAVDKLIRTLHELRQELLTEMRLSDEDFASRHQQ
jgi:hypothetical protein